MGKVIHLDDKTGGGGSGTGWDGEVNTFADLPDATLNDGKIYLVKTKTGSQLTFNLKRSGFYIAESGSWRKLSNAQMMFTDNELTFSDDAYPTKQLGFELSSIGAGQRRTATFQNKNGTVAYLSDITGNLPSGLENQILYNDGLGNYVADYLSGLYRTFKVVDNEGTQNLNSGSFFGALDVMPQGYYTRAGVYFQQINLSPAQQFTLRVGIYDFITLDLISQGSLILTNTNERNHIFNLDTPINLMQSQPIYAVLGANDNIGGGSIAHYRQTGNQINDPEQVFQLNIANGALPNSLAGLLNNSTNNVFQLLIVR